MGCLVVLVALVVPRAVMLIAFLTTDWFQSAFESRAWPFLGFVFMPYTTFAYMAAMLNNNHALTGVWLALFIAAIVVDAAHWFGGDAFRRRSLRSRESS